MSHFSDKVEELDGGGFVINRGTESSSKSVNIESLVSVLASFVRSIGLVFVCSKSVLMKALLVYWISTVVIIG